MNISQRIFYRQINEQKTAYPTRHREITSVNLPKLNTEFDKPNWLVKVNIKDDDSCELNFMDLESADNARRDLLLMNR